MKKKQLKTELDIFNDLKSSFLDLDPASFIENNLTLDGQPFKILGNGWRFMVDIYRYIALQSTKKNGKPVVIKKGRQVGATMMAGALDLYFTNSGIFNNPPVRVIHLFPALAQVKKFSQDKLEGMIRTAKNDSINNNKLKSANAVDNLTMKQFKAGTLWIDSVGADGDRIRGMTVDIAFMDEIQDMTAQGVGNATKILTAAKYGPTGKGVQVYFGTPKERGSYFNTLWDMSDKRYYYLGCFNCKKHFPFYTPESDSWREVWVSGYKVKCSHCGTVQTKVDAIERGKWVVTEPDAKYVGFHINQLYIPYFSKENILDLMPENNPAQTERIWNNEVIGEFYSGAGLPITKTDLYNKCRDPDRAFSKKINPHNKQTYMGVDWGGKDDIKGGVGGKSYSCVVVLSAGSDGTLYVEHAHKLRKNNFDYKKDTIKEVYRRFGIRRGVSDWFFGQDVVHDLQVIYGDKFLGAQGSGSLVKPIKYREDELIVSYNKDLMIEEIFDLFRKGKIRFPWGSYEYIDWLLDHCTSMEIKQKMSSGNVIKTYVKGPTPNDGLMALMYAYMAYKFDLTKGYSVKPGITKEVRMPHPVLAHVKRPF
jgi:hypothetical protein